jgi:hypothetical protein
LSSRPPDVEVPLPLRLGFIALPVVGDVPGVAELAAGSPVVDPRPLGTPPPCAWAKLAPRTKADANAMTLSFIIEFLSDIYETNGAASRMFLAGRRPNATST